MGLCKCRHEIAKTRFGLKHYNPRSVPETTKYCRSCDCINPIPLSHRGQSDSDTK